MQRGVYIACTDPLRGGWCLGNLEIRLVQGTSLRVGGIGFEKKLVPIINMELLDSNNWQWSSPVHPGPAWVPWYDLTQVPTQLHSACLVTQPAWYPSDLFPVPVPTV